MKVWIKITPAEIAGDEWGIGSVKNPIGEGDNMPWKVI
jgi:hypothetical protein